MTSAERTWWARKKRSKGGAPRELGGFEAGPAAEEVTKDGGVFLLKPLQDVGEGVFPGTGQAIRATDFVTDQPPAMFDELCQGTHGRALGREWGELVAVFKGGSRPGVQHRWGRLWPGWE